MALHARARVGIEPSRERGPATLRGHLPEPAIVEQGAKLSKLIP